MIVQYNNKYYKLDRVEVNFARVNQDGTPYTDNGVTDSGNGSMVITSAEFDAMPQANVQQLADGIAAVMSSAESES